MRFDEIVSLIAATCLMPRGGFSPEPGDEVPALPDGRAARSVVLVGNAGPAAWRAFERAKRGEGEADPLNRWTREVLDPLAERCGAHAIYPFTGPPYLPFLRWAQRSEPVAPSPIGMLIHPDYGLWHAYRGALLFAEALDLPEFQPRPIPCESCAEKPCLSSCPVEALRPGEFDVAACAGHLHSPPGSECVEGGCLARRACPVGREYRYEGSQIRFHMRAFRRSLGAD